VEAAEIPTIVKTRIIARQQQVVRVDRERRLPTSNSAHDAVLGQLPGMLHGVDGVIFEDYNKGFLNQGFVDRVSSMVVEAGKILTADPNPGNPLCWPGATTIKPNRSEAFLMSGSNDPGPTDNPILERPLLEAGERLLEKYPVRSVLVTLSEHRMILFDRAKPLATPTRQGSSTCRAGHRHRALYPALRRRNLAGSGGIFNHASGVVVGKFGTATVTREELLTSFQSHAF
jgi:D-beta-D-heptose 7-phosphate kinase/D-beta-D-heptose 1-phosphate adenosyltransferase